MATLDLSAFSDVLKTDYLDGINDNTVRSSVLYNILNSSDDITETTGGNFAYISLLRRGNPGIGSRNEGETLPTPNYSRHTKATFGLVTLYQRGRIGGKVTRAARKGKAAAFAEALDTQLQSMMEDLPHEHNRMLHGRGGGVLTTFSTTQAISSTTFIVHNIQYLQVDDVVTVAGSTNGLGVSSAITRSISAINESTKQVTLDGLVTTWATTLPALFRDLSQGKEIYGIQNMSDTTNPTYITAGGFGNVGGIDVTAAAGTFYHGNVLHNSGTTRPLSRGLMQQGRSTMAAKGRGQLKLIICDYDLWNTYGNLLAPDQNFGEKIYEMDGGFDALDFVRTPVVPDVDCLPNRMHFIDTRTLVILEYSRGYEFMEADGAILRYASNGDVDEVVFAMLKDMQLGASQRNNQVRIEDLATNTA